VAFDKTYPCPPGNKMWSIYDVPLASVVYTVFAPVAGGTPTGGIYVDNAKFGLVNVEMAWCLGSQDGTYTAVPYVIPFSIGGSAGTAQVVLSLYTATTMAQVASSTLPSTAGYIRIMALGN